MNRFRFPRLPRITATLAVLLAAALASHAAPAADQKSLIKAAFIYNFARFTDWPAGSFADARSSLRVCYEEGHPLAAALATIDGKQVGDRTIAVVPSSRAAGAAPGCHIAVVGPAGIGTSAQASRGVLTVGDIGDFAETRTAIGLIEVGRQVRFQVSTAAIARADLRVSSKLLRLAAKVIR